MKTPSEKDNYFISITYIHYQYIYCFYFTGTETPALKVLAFQEGSHYAFLKYPEIINNEIVTFLQSENK